MSLPAEPNAETAHHVGAHPKPKVNRLKLAVAVGIVLLGATLAADPDIRDQLTMDSLREKVEWLRTIFNGPYGFWLFLAASIVAIQIQLPGLVMVIVAALVYPPVKAFVYGMIGSIFGTTIGFFIFRYLLRDFVRPRLQRSFLAKFIDRIEQHGVITMAILRVVLQMSPPLTWLMGATNIRIRDFFIGNMLGLVPLILVAQTVTRELQRVDTWRDIFSAQFLAILVGLIMFYATIFFVKKTWLTPGAPNLEEEI
ncbi:MAG: TVP38/TMEM64 family protein [Deltaproteobacteria bacterium]|nr:TVP38/TMEM64 family protein [bacterium]MCB9489672.1 TVP38/TMEM64 family protein [Deltaproteobacteria bacterium]